MIAASTLAQLTRDPEQGRAALEQIVRVLDERQTPRDLHPKQRAAFESPATELLYGGAAGGGKSHLMRRAAIQWCRWVPGLQVYLFRREFPDLFKNHMEGPSSFPPLLARDLETGDARIIWHKNQIRFENGSVIHLCHAQHEKDVLGYQGSEIHVLLIDELTQWTASMYRYLRGRVRLGGLRVPAWIAHLFPRILCSANPGGVGHTWVKADFVDFAPEGEIRTAPRKDGGMRRQFIRSLLEDNPTMLANDPDYADRLEGLGDPALVRAMRLGDWDIVAGGMFDDVWDRRVHVLPPFRVPVSWRIDRSFDWGSAKPFSVGWWAESDGSPAVMADGMRRHFARGTLVRIAEWYGARPGDPNVGLKLLAVDIADGIREREALWRQAYGWRVHPGPADASIFDVENGMSIAADMAKRGVRWLAADKSPGTRKTGAEALRRRLTAAARQPREEPGLFVSHACVDWIRTVPVLPRDTRLTDDVDTKAEDHAYDETRYRLLAPRHGVHMHSLSP
jgi:hypothetical protein